MEEQDEITELVLENMRIVHEQCVKCQYWNGVHCTRNAKDGCVVKE